MFSNYGNFYQIIITIIINIYILMLLLYKLFRKAIVTIYTTKKKTSHEKKRKYLLPKGFLIKTKKQHHSVLIDGFQLGQVKELGKKREDRRHGCAATRFLLADSRDALCTSAVRSVIPNMSSWQRFSSFKEKKC